MCWQSRIVFNELNALLTYTFLNWSFSFLIPIYNSLWKQIHINILIKLHSTDEPEKIKINNRMCCYVNMICMHSLLRNYAFAILIKIFFNVFVLLNRRWMIVPMILMHGQCFMTHYRGAELRRLNNIWPLLLVCISLFN